MSLKNFMITPLSILEMVLTSRSCRSDMSSFFQPVLSKLTKLLEKQIQDTKKEFSTEKITVCPYSMKNHSFQQAFNTGER